MNPKSLLLPLLPLLLLAGCTSADQEAMRNGLAREGLNATQASCYAEALAGIIGADEYNYIAKLMGAGASQKDALNRTRRRFGPDFKSAMSKEKAQLDACLE